VTLGGCCCTDSFAGEDGSSSFDDNAWRRAAAWGRAPSCRPWVMRPRARAVRTREFCGCQWRPSEFSSETKKSMEHGHTVRIRKKDGMPV